MRQFFLILIFFNCSCLAIAQNFELWDSLVRDLKTKNEFYGSVLLAQGDRVFREDTEGYQDYRKDLPLNEHSAFNLASVSKQFFAMGIMMLKKEGLLVYDDPVSKFLVDFPYSDITIRHLLTHTSGLTEYFDPANRHFPLNHFISSQDILDLFQKLKPALEFASGSQWNYCNTNYVILALIIEKLSQQPIEVFMAERIFKPLELNDTYVYHLNIPDQHNNRVIGYRNFEDRAYPNDLTHMDGVYGDGNIYSSVRDLHTWLVALTSGTLLPLEDMEEAWTPVKLNDGTTYPYGFGWFIDGPGMISHTGSWVGFRNLVRVNLNTKSLLIICSNNTSSSLRVLDQVLQPSAALDYSTTLITNVNILDGRGTPAFYGSIRLRGNKIQEIGDLNVRKGETVIDGEKKTLSPGFIDCHSHHDQDYLAKDDLSAALSQGITTIVVGQDGFSQFPLQSFYDRWAKQPGHINIASFIGHNTLRLEVLGNKSFQRTATKEEITQMRELLKNELQSGALGLSTGLEYDPGIWSNTEEVLALAKIAGSEGGRYASHMRSEDVQLEDALEELLTIGREAKIPVHISHFKIGMKGKWGIAKELIQRLILARQEGIQVSADIYPYTYWHSTLEVLFPQRDFDNRKSAEFALSELSTPEGMLLARYDYHPAYVGKTISQIAQELNLDPAETYIKLIHDARLANAPESVIGTAMSEQDISQILTWPFVSLCSDGSGSSRHPRGFGAFPRFFSQYIRKDQLLTVAEAVRRVTTQAAENCGITNRGLIAPGYYADLVLWDPDNIQDYATTQEPHLKSSGISKVWVNGVVTYQNGQVLSTRPGVVIKRN